MTALDIVSVAVMLVAVPVAVHCRQCMCLTVILLEVQACACSSFCHAASTVICGTCSSGDFALVASITAIGGLGCCCAAQLVIVSVAAILVAVPVTVKASSTMCLQ